MIIETDGIILKQTKTVDGRRMITLFSKQRGKINAGTGISEKGRNRTALALRPFTYGRYVLYSGRSGFNINSADTLKSYYGIGEDVDKYMFSSYILELTERLLPEEQPSPGLFDLLTEFFDLMEKRSREYETPVTAFVVKALRYAGIQPELKSCVCCGRERPEGKQKGKILFSIENGGIVCRECGKVLLSKKKESLIYGVSFDILNIAEYFLKSKMNTLERLTMNEQRLKELQTLLKAYLRCHLGVGDLKSEHFLENS